MEDPEVQAEEVKKSKLEKEQQALVEFLESEGYKAAQKINQEVVDEHIQTLVDLSPDDGGVALYLFKVTHIIADIRTKLDFKNQFKDRLKEIEEELNPKNK